MATRKPRAVARIEPAIAFYPNRATNWERIGDHNYPGPGSESFMLHLTAIVHGNGYMPSDRINAIETTVLYVWISDSPAPSWNYKFELFAHGVTYATPTRMVEQARTLRAMARLVAWNNQYLQHQEVPFEARLRGTLRALGITKAKCYQAGGDPYYVDLDDKRFTAGETGNDVKFSVLDNILAEFDRRRAKALRGRPIEELAMVTA